MRKQCQRSCHLFEFFVSNNKAKLFRAFCNLKFENSITDNKLFRRTFRGQRIVYPARKDQIKYFVQNKIVKIKFFYVKTASWLAVSAATYTFLSLCRLTKTFFAISRNGMFLESITLLTTTTSDCIPHKKAETTLSFPDY